MECHIRPKRNIIDQTIRRYARHVLGQKRRDIPLRIKGIERLDNMLGNNADDILGRDNRIKGIRLAHNGDIHDAGSQSRRHHKHRCGRSQEEGSGKGQRNLHYYGISPIITSFGRSSVKRFVCEGISLSSRGVGSRVGKREFLPEPRPRGAGASRHEPRARRGGKSRPCPSVSWRCRPSGECAARAREALGASRQGVSDDGRSVLAGKRGDQPLSATACACVSRDDMTTKAMRG